MPRTAPLDFPGLLQHVMGGGIEKRAIFLDEQDRRSFLDRLGAAGVSIAAWRGEVFLKENPGLKERLISQPIAMSKHIEKVLKDNPDKTRETKLRALVKRLKEL